VQPFESTGFPTDDDATEADFDTIWHRYFAQREAYNRDLLDLRFQLKDQMTREEWQHVFGKDQASLFLAFLNSVVDVAIVE
jgi:hypothetical protein